VYGGLVRRTPMNFTETAVEGAYLIGIEPIEDARGFLARTWCLRELDAPLPRNPHGAVQHLLQ
jgi:dTDP-4-dehydrorhamnose 3,5-epimerase-like enzyme